jgi:hypothetical protein
VINLISLFSESERERTLRVAGSPEGPLEPLDVHSKLIQLVGTPDKQLLPVLEGEVAAGYEVSGEGQGVVLRETLVHRGQG